MRSARMLDRNSVTYLLSYHPKNTKDDGAYRKIRVRAKGAPRGANVYHRPGYMPARSYGELNPDGEASDHSTSLAR